MPNEVADDWFDVPAAIPETPRWLYSCVGGGSGSWLVGPSHAVGWGYAVPRSGSVGLGVRVQHQFMVRSYGYYMTSKTLVSDLRTRFLEGDQATAGLFVLPRAC